MTVKDTTKNTMGGKQHDDLGSFASGNEAAEQKDLDNVHVIAPSSNGNDSGTDGADYEKSLMMSSNSNTSDAKKDKRFLPSYKKPDAALTFPEKVSSAQQHNTMISVF